MRITSTLLISKDFRDSKVSGLLTAFRLQNAFAEKKAIDIEIPLFCLSKDLLNISVTVSPFLVRLVPLFNSLKTLRCTLLSVI